MARLDGPGKERGIGGSILYAVIGIGGLGLFALTISQSRQQLVDRNKEVSKRGALIQRLETQLAEAKRSNENLHAQLNQMQETRKLEAAVSSSAVSMVELVKGNKQLLEVHARWDWPSLAKEFLSNFPQISLTQLDRAAAECFNNDTMYCSRIQIYNQQLYVTDYRAIFFDRQYAPARLMPLLEMLIAFPNVPNVDIVVSANDEPKISMSNNAVSWTKMVQKYPGFAMHNDTDKRKGLPAQLPPPMFSNTVNLETMDLPWLDFSFFFPRKSHKLRTAPWKDLHGSLLQQGQAVKWEDKLELAMHTGNVGSSWRKQLASVATRFPGEVLVNELFMGDEKIRKTCAEQGLHRKGGYQKHLCYMKFTDQCSYKYLLNSASIGFANKFKSLLLCGSVVIYVSSGMRHKEFYEWGLLPGVHYVTAADAEAVPGVVRWLRQNDDYAKGVALAGQARLAALDHKAVLSFTAELLTQYSKRQTFTVKPQPGSVQINCEDDLWRHYAKDPWFMNHFLTQDNASCIIRPQPPFKPPGWGGTWKGSKVRCSAGHDRLPRAQPTICDLDKGLQIGESYEPYGVFPRAHPNDRQCNPTLKRSPVGLWPTCQKLRVDLVGSVPEHW